MNFLKLDKKIRNIWLIIGGIIFVIFDMLYLIIALATNFNVPFMICGGIVIFITGVLCFGFPVLKYNLYSYFYDDLRIIIRKGIIFKYEIIIPTLQIQDLHLYQGPLMQIAKVQGVEISTAGSNYTIIGLDYNVATTMVKQLEENLRSRVEANNEIF